MQKIFIINFFLFIFFFVLSEAVNQQPQENNVQLENEANLFEKNSSVKQQQEETVMVVVVNSGDIDCFYQSIVNSKHTAFEIDYQVIDGGENDISFTIKSPKGIVIVNEIKQTEGTHKIEINKPDHGYGDYAICFDNTFSYTSSKKVFFELFLLDKNGNFLNDYDIKTLTNEQKQGLGMQLIDFNRITNRIQSNLNEVERIQSHARAIEARDRLTMESNYKLVNWFGFFNMAGLIVAAFVQVFTIRSLFTEQSKIGKFIRYGKLSN